MSSTSLRRALLAAASIGAALPALAPAPLRAQAPDAADLLRRIFATGEFSARQRLGPVRWIEGGAAYTALEPSEAVRGARDLVRYEAATGLRRVMVSARKLIPEGAAEPLDVDDYAWSADGTRLLVFTNTKKVWRQNTRGDYWVLDTRSGALRKLGGSGAPESSLMYAKFSPQGDRVAYVRQGDLYAERLADGTITRLTTGADSLHVSGMSDWVYEEEFDLRDGFRWSPDGARIAFWQFDMSGVRTFRLINDTDSLYPIVTPIQYPKAGTTNSAVRAGVVALAGGAVTWIALGDDLRENYLPRMEWAGPATLVLQRMNRLQNTDRVLLADAASGAVRTVLTERDSAWVDLVDNVTWLHEGAELLWVSERDGWRHVYRVARTGERTTLVTPGAFDVVSVAGVDEPGGWLYYIASPDNPTQRYLFRVRLDGKGPPERLTPRDQPGTHTYELSPGARWAIHSWSRFDRPPVSELVRLPGHQAVRPFVDDTAQRAAVARLISRPAEFFRVPVSGGVTLD
ncbi:MAG: S9 family peptidase, partial [Gemmatimonadetes bacterium]